MSSFQKRMNAKYIKDRVFDEMVLTHVVDPFLAGLGFVTGISVFIAIYMILKGAAA